MAGRRDIDRTYKCVSEWRFFLVKSCICSFILSCFWQPYECVTGLSKVFWVVVSRYVCYSVCFSIFDDRCGSLWDRCGSLWVVVGRCGSLWIVVGHCGSFRVLVTTWYPTWNDSHFSVHTGSVIARVNKDRIFRWAPGLSWEVCWCKIRASRSNIMFGTWNVRTLRMAGKFEELTYQTRRYGWNILGLSDVWWKNFDETSTLEGHKWYFSGKEENHEQVGDFLFKRTSWKLSWPAVPSQAVLSPSAWVQVHWTSQLYRPIRPYHGLW